MNKLKLFFYLKTTKKTKKIKKIKKIMAEKK